MEALSSQAISNQEHNVMIAFGKYHPKIFSRDHLIFPFKPIRSDQLRVLYNSGVRVQVALGGRVGPDAPTIIRMRNEGLCTKSIRAI